MPTPDDDTVQHLPSLAPASAISRSLHATCPPEDDRSIPHHPSSQDDTVAGSPAPEPEPEPDPNSTRALQEVVEEIHASIGASEPTLPAAERDRERHGSTRHTPSSIDIPKHEDASSVPPIASPPNTGPLAATLCAPEALSPQPTPKSTSSFLKHGSRFTGTQKSDKQVYKVEVEIKHVDMGESFICGYLKIEGLTADHPTLTTFFEGEIIGNKYTFQTRHPEWGSNEKVDMQHWNRFQAWRPLSRQARRPDFSYKNFAEREHIFMRWKEYFLVPNHRVRTISGASFEGFYYICFNQARGTISGIYFHSKSEKFQQLELTHVEDRGCHGALEFR